MSEFQARLDEIDEDTAIVLICRTGSRSQMAGDFLVASGYDNVYNILEGTMGWLRRDLPTEQG
jgi:rhodanese-related sulfurtransferase